MKRKAFNRAATALQCEFPRVRTQRTTGLTMSRPLLVSVLMMFASAAAAQVFECADAKGVKQYARFCPPGTVQQRQVVKEGDGSAAAASPAGAAPKTLEAQDAEFRKRELERREAAIKTAQDKAEAEESERNCLDARSQLQTAEEGLRMQRFDPATGERIQFGDDERAEETERQRKAIALWCK